MMTGGWLAFECSIQLASCLHLFDNIQTTDQFAFHIELWIGGPVRIYFQSLTYFLILQNIERIVLDTASDDMYIQLYIYIQYTVHTQCHS